MFFTKKRCPRCNEKISKNYAFCPHCGIQIKEAERLFEPAFNLGFPFNAIFKQLEKQIERELRSIDKNMDKPLLDSDPMPLVQGLTINVDSSGRTPVIRVSTMGDKKKNEKIIPKETVGLRTMITEEKANRMASLPKEEPSTNVRRLTDRIVYEIEMPGVDKENIVVTKLHNSIEIKAFSKDKTYFKLIPLSLPILNSKLEEGKLVLEFKP